MFKKFTKEDVHTQTNVKSSVQRALKAKLVDEYPKLESVIGDLVPKKSSVVLYRCEDKIQLYAVDKEVMFYQNFDELLPALRMVHMHPSCFPRVQVDRGAIKFILSGANIMCPGLTSPGAKLPDEDWPEGTTVAVYAEGKENALAIGKLLMSVDEIKKVNKGMGIELIHYLGDGLWDFNVD
ncbi:translation machinery-associated protein 20 [Brettanomyces nanus]|uniref:Translation machinery-associated protein 20 n=1 Tax=Eeniella nana TaxID=13502 RepID=A0A875S018_EENNA|nr:translation machinery-associated protein 20 [Brettanomyces nanus]QPG74318.1 translation machinery-associated protein 20 [Brettanomyces nanus]